IIFSFLSAVSPIFTWDPDIHRYESYDLEKGPVFYEAYYPDVNEEPRSNYQEKRYFDQGTILEKTYQVPSEHLTYPENNIQLDNYQNRADTSIRNDDRFFFETKARPLDVKEISKLARRAITRDLENWNTLENYLDHAKDLVYRRRYVIPEPGYRVEQLIRRPESNLPDPLNEQHNLRRDLYEEVREEPLALPSRVESSEGQRDSLRRLTVRDLTDRDSLESFRSIRYENQSPRERENVVQAVRTSQINAPSMRNINPSSSGSIVDPYYPTENIFAPRPQVINYIFSRKPEIKENAENKVQSLKPETKETGERMPRNYGDNLIQDEMRKTTEEDKDVKVTSIEVSEVPRHKTRHHHGEWPKRDYSRRRQS
ncbi:hypothetical protein WN51_08602, partial [Melipona quadrifasciata]